MENVIFNNEIKNFIIQNNEVTFNLPFRQQYKEEFSSLKLEDFDLYILQNPIYNNEADCFEVYVESQDRTGFIFPIALLDSEDEYDNILCKYIFLASIKLLKTLDSKFDYMPNNFCQLFPSNSDNICLLILSHFDKEQFNFDELKLSFQMFGYDIYNEKKIIHYENSNTFREISNLLINGKNKLKIKKTDYNNYKNTIVNTLISNYLSHTIIPVQRFLFVYQILEYYMREIENSRLSEIISIAQQASPDMNQLINKIQNIRKEIDQLNQIYNPNKPSDSFYRIRVVFFDLYENIFNEKNRDEIHCIYSIRNKLFHSYWHILDNNITNFDKLLLLAEKLILGMLIQKYKI